MPEEKKGYPSARKRIKIEKALILEHLRKTPLIEIVCKKMDISRATICRWRKDDPAFRIAFDEAVYYGLEATNDVVESALMKAIQNGNASLIKFFLQHRHPAYSARAAQVKREREESLGIADNADELTDEQKRRINDLDIALGKYLKDHEHVGLLKPDGAPDTNDPNSASSESPSHQ